MRPRQNGRLFANDTFKRIFLNQNIRISTKNSLKFVPTGLINNIPALVLIMAWRRPGDKPLSEPMLVKSLTHICVTQPQWVNSLRHAGQCVYVSELVQITACRPVPRQAINWTKADVLSIRSLETNLHETWIKIHIFSFRKTHLQKSSAKSQRFCSDISVIKNNYQSYICRYSTLKRKCRFDEIFVTRCTENCQNNENDKEVTKSLPVWHCLRFNSTDRKLRNQLPISADRDSVMTFIRNYKPR